MPRRTVVVTAADVADGRIDRLLAADDDAPPFVVVQIAEVTADVAQAAAQRLADRTGPAIGALREPSAGIGPAANDVMRALDVTYTARETGRVDCLAADVDAAIATIENACTATPMTVSLFAAALRICNRLPVPDALAVESLTYATLQSGREHRRWLCTHPVCGKPLPPPGAEPTVDVDREAGHLTITLNLPERRNAVSAQLRHELVDALCIAIADRSIDHVTVAGRGPAFCAGGDLGEFGLASDFTVAHLTRLRESPAALVHLLADRIEFDIHGPCVGAGIEIPSFASRIRAQPATTFRMPEIGMGLIPGAGGTVGLPRRIGRWRAFDLCVTGRTLDAPTALTWGLIDEIDGGRP